MRSFCVSASSVVKMPRFCSQKSISHDRERAMPVTMNIPRRAGESDGRIVMPARSRPMPMNVTCAKTCAVLPATTLDAPLIGGTPRLRSRCTLTASPPM